MLKAIEKIITQPLLNPKQENQHPRPFNRRASSFVTTRNKMQAISPVGRSIDPLPLESMKMEFTLSGTNSRVLGAPLSEEKVSSNLAYDGYQCVLGVGTEEGSIIVFSIKGKSKTTKISNVTNKKSIVKIGIVSNQPFIIAINSAQDLFLVDYSSQTSQMIPHPEGFDSSEESFTLLYIPDFLYGSQENDDFVFFGTDQANIHVFSVSEQKFIFKISNPFGSESHEHVWGDENHFQISDIKINMIHTSKLIISYRHATSEESAVSVFSIAKNKETQLLYFQPSVHTDLGQAMAIDFSPDSTQFAVVFSSGKLQVFKSQAKIQSGLIRPLYTLELNNNGALTSAKMRWRELGDWRHCLQVFYKGGQQEKEIALFMGNFRQPLSKSFFINTLPNIEDQIKDCIYGDFMISDQTDVINSMIGNLLQTQMDDKYIQLRDSKTINLNANLLIALSENNKLYYYNSDMIGIQAKLEEDKEFKLLPTIFQTQSLLNTNQFRIEKFISVDIVCDKQFIQFIEDLGTLHRQNKLYQVAKYDQHLQEFINKKGSSSSKRQRSQSRGRRNSQSDKQTPKILNPFSANKTEVASFFMSGKDFQNQSDECNKVNSLILGYIIGISDKQTITIARVETQKVVTILQDYSMGNDQNDQICAIEVSKQFKMIVLSFEGGNTYLLDKSLQAIKNEFREIEYFKVSLCPFQCLDSEYYQQVAVMQIIPHSNQQEALLVQGFTNGRIKIYNISKQRVLLNLSSIVDQHKITCIEKQRTINKDQSSILLGDANGNIIQILVKEKETVLSKSRQIESSGIIQIQNNLQSNRNQPQLPSEHFFVLTEQSLFSLDRLSLSIKNQYQIPENYGSLIDDEQPEKFSQLIHTKMGDSSDNQFAVACFLEQKKWLLLFEPENQVCYMVKDLSSSKFDIQKVFSTHQKGVFIMASKRSQYWVFTFRRKRLEFGLQEKSTLPFSYSWASKVQIKPIKRSLISQIIAIKQSNLYEQMVKAGKMKNVRSIRSQLSRFEDKNMKKQLAKQTSGHAFFRSTSSSKSFREDSVLLSNCKTQTNENKSLERDYFDFEVIDNTSRRNSKNSINSKNNKQSKSEATHSELSVHNSFSSIQRQELQKSNSFQRKGEGFEQQQQTTQGQQGKQTLQQQQDADFFKSRTQERRMSKSIALVKRATVTSKRRLSTFHQQE